MFLVLWSVDRGMNYLKMDRELEDHWLTFDTYLEAEAFYEDLVKQDDTYTASIAQPVKSTDYDVVDVMP